jgi:hypothetical protein
MGNNNVMAETRDRITEVRLHLPLLRAHHCWLTLPSFLRTPEARIFE